jgi:hypothetical protein
MTSTDDNEKTEKYICDFCHFKTHDKKDYTRHLLTLKHKNHLNYKKTDKKTEKKPKKTEQHICCCGNIYKHRQSLHNHRKKCKFLLDKEDMSLKDMFIEVVKQNQAILLDNQELKKTLHESISYAGNTINNTTNNNTQFNLNFFLNEQCKDAINITDFVNSLKMQLSDLEMIGKLGYSEGISKIFIRGLKELDIFKRPIHCSDVKRETMYIRDDDNWEKDTNENKKLKYVINKIADKNIQQIPLWINKNPDANDYESKKHDEYIKIVGESMGGSDDVKSFSKIVKNIAKEFHIEK